MKRIGLVATALLVSLCPAPGGELKWEPQLRTMGYLFLHLSNINVINGLNLTREQAVKLRELARQVEAVTPAPQSPNTPLCPELEEVRGTWLEARALLLDGKAVPAELEERVGRSRVKESAVLRKTIRPRPTALDTRCVSCHMAPGTEAGPPMTVTPRLKGLMNRAHAEGLYGRAGLVKMAFLSSQVKAILSDGQEAILGDFSCCLVPPQDLSNPTRAGQAESSQKSLDLMRRIRECPPQWWPLLRGGLLTAVDRLTGVVSPGAGEARKAATRAEIEKLLDRVRGMSDVEFEMEKEALARAVKEAIMPGTPDTPLKAAYFLLIPGSVEVYDRYLARLDGAGSGAASAGR